MSSAVYFLQAKQRRLDFLRKDVAWLRWPYKDCMMLSSRLVQHYCSPSTLAFPLGQSQLSPLYSLLPAWSYSGGLRQAFIVDKHFSDYFPQKVYGFFFSDKKSTIGFCFVSCYCIMVEMLKKRFPWKWPALSWTTPTNYGCLNLHSAYAVPTIPYN